MTTTDRLGSAEVTLPNDTDINIVRRFNAPARRIFDVWTTPAHVRRWWSDETRPVTECSIDLTVGGRWRYAIALPNGAGELGWHGTYREIVLGERLVSTEVFEGFPDAIAVNSLTLVEVDGVTTMTVVVQHTCKLHRDGHVESGMEPGMQDALDRVERLAGDPESTSEIADRFKIISDGFTRRVLAVSPGAWENPSPCAGWTARDVVRHVTTWIPGFFGSVAGLSMPETASVDDDPVGAWTVLNDALAKVLADPAASAREFDGPPGRMSIENSIDMIVTGDLLIHIWDLARAAGLDEVLDPIQVHRMFEGVGAHDAALRSSGHYGPRILVPEDADEQTQLLAFMGRDPSPTAR